MANVFFVLTCLGLLVNIASSDDMDCTRPPPPQWREEMKCCKMPGMKHRDFSTGRDCMKEIEDAHPEFEFKRHHHPKPFGNNNITQCFEQCVYKKSSLLDGDNKLNSTAIREDVTKQLTGVWKEVGIKLVDECLETAQKKVAENAECKSGSFEFKMCFLRGLFMNCPAESWTDSDVCKALKTRLEKCPDLPPPPPHHHHHHHHHHDDDDDDDHDDHDDN